MTAHTPATDYGRSNRAPVQYYELNGLDDKDGGETAALLRRWYATERQKMVRAPLVAAVHLSDDTIIKRVIGAMLDYEGTPQAAFIEETGPDMMRSVADTLEDAAKAIREIADRMEEPE